MDIYLSINNNQQVIQLPVLPDQYEMTYPMNNTTKSTINSGDMRLIGLKGLKSISFSSFFPSKEYGFIREKTAYSAITNEGYLAWDYVKLIEEWMEERVPIRLVITDTPINIAVTIDSFTYGIKDGSGDIHYSISLTEFRFVETNKKKVI